MKELKKLSKIEKVGYNETLNAKTFTIENKEYVLSGGEFSASGVMNYLRLVENVLENKDDETYKRSRSDVIYYVKNSTMAKMEDLEEEKNMKETKDILTTEQKLEAIKYDCYRNGLNLDYSIQAVEKLSGHNKDNAVDFLYNLVSNQVIKKAEKEALRKWN